ncbi:hypothetical protein K474DRAFT_1661033 [Panus rudis PR-1116 ss-1]|nr:hypothetical protein K474DRAFT_1661033 [Panus rudis PR-1116 ss-1]
MTWEAVDGVFCVLTCVGGLVVTAFGRSFSDDVSIEADVLVSLGASGLAVTNAGQHLPR